MKNHFPCGHWHKRRLSSASCERVKKTNYAFKATSNYNARVVRYSMSPFARIDYYDIHPNGAYNEDSYGQAYGVTYDTTLGKVFVGLYSCIDSVSSARVAVFTDELEYLSTIILEVGNASVDDMCAWSEGGKIYVYTFNSSAPVDKRKFYEIDAVTETVTRSVVLGIDQEPLIQSNRIWVDYGRGYIYWSVTEGVGDDSYVVGFNISKMAIDKQSPVISSTDNWWGILTCALNKCAGVIYAAHPKGPVYYPTHYAITAIDLDTMEIIETIELNDPVQNFPYHIELSNDHIYSLGKDTYGSVRDYTIVTCTRSPLAEISRVPIHLSANVGYFVPNDMKLCVTDRVLLIIGNGTAVIGGVTKDVTIDQCYSIATGIPVFMYEIQTIDELFVEIGGPTDTFACGEVFDNTTASGNSTAIITEPMVWSMPSGQHY